MATQSTEQSQAANAGDLGAALEAISRLQNEVHWLRSKTDIADLIVSYARACDRGNDPVMLRPLFTDDATWECKGFGRYQGGEMVAAALKGIAGEKIWWSLHNMISPQIEILSPDTAKAFWYLWEAATIPNEHSGDPEAYWIGGTYDAAFRRVDGKWLISEMELKLNMASPASHAWVEKRFPDGTRKQPYFKILKAGNYYWCACGKSATQPFCDGSHNEAGRVKPQEFTVAEDGLQVLCGCRYSKTKPYCDGSHLNLKLKPSGAAGAG